MLQKFILITFNNLRILEHVVEQVDNNLGMPEHDDPNHLQKDDGNYLNTLAGQADND